MNKFLEKVKNVFGCKCGKKEEPKPQQEQPKPQEKPKEQKQIKPLGKWTSQTRIEQKESGK